MSQAPAPLAVVLNATAGTGCPPDWIEKLRAQFADHGVAAQVLQAKEGSDIIPTVRRLLDGGARTIVAGGGDGTVSAVASQLAGTDAVLGVLPLGTLNHFAKDLGMPLAQEEAVAALVAGSVTTVDVGEVNGRIFINNSSLGLYPDIVRDREQRQRRLGHSKWRALAAASLDVLRRYPVLRVQVDLDDETHALRTPFLFIGNNEYTMEGFQIGERRGLSDGSLAVYTAQRTGRFGLLRLALLALFHRLQQARDFHTALAREFVVHSGHRKLRVATDGEVTLMDTPLHYRCRPGALRVIAPPAPSAA
ncbi:diacylglycerol kinase family lipid kinase [Ramlibacter sp. XY19]|uniref:diacylglycerol/lipid kinase family protein n=1 Tax=Ramlibacter paludis TaxID=2908000 RepID=UPI0023DC544C|nr:diacylglycerol kinase family protein [Ramlibacter paludis]MCG2592544.1 diacylglycerol kinase family lipid kinase [Ramlibacter paludis]